MTTLITQEMITVTSHRMTTLTTQEMITPTSHKMTTLTTQEMVTPTVHKMKTLTTLDMNVKTATIKVVVLQALSHLLKSLLTKAIVSFNGLPIYC